MNNDVFKETALVFPQPIQQFVFYDKYSKFNWEKGRREGWSEVVERVTDHLKWLSKGRLSDSEYQGIHDAIYSAQVAPSMRLMRTAGEAARRIDLLGYNCAYTPINCIDAIVELFWLSMCGVGVGYSVEQKYIDMLPPVAKKKKVKIDTHVIADSAEGWRDAFRLGLEAWWDGGDVKFDYSEIRPAGAPLRTKGGAASGHGVLRDLLDYSRELIRNRSGNNLSTVDTFDLCTSVANCAVSGGSRRSAMLVLFDKDDEGMLSAKTNGFWETHPNRANANISVAINEELNRGDFEKLVRRMIENETGEPGIVSRYAMQKSKPEWRKDMPEAGLNPCQPEFATILTPSGIRTMGDINVGDVIWSGDNWTTVVDKWETGVKPVYNYSASFGEFLGTENHRVLQNGEKIEVMYADAIDASAGPTSEMDSLDPLDVMDGLVIGDGSVHAASNNRVYLYIGENDGDYFDSKISHLLTRDRTAGFGNSGSSAYEIDSTIKAEELPYTYDRVVPGRFLFGGQNKIKGFLRGLFSANGSVVANGRRVTLKQTSHQLIRDVQKMLSGIGIRSYITINKSSKIEWHNGTYESRQSYDLNITQDRYIFKDHIGFIQNYKNDAIAGDTVSRKASGVIQSVEYLGDFPVYDITVDDPEHTYWTGGLVVSNCAEVMLNPVSRDGEYGGEVCNLSSVHIRSGDILPTLIDKVKWATIIGTIQSMADTMPGLRQAWRDIQKEERLLGVSLVGATDNPDVALDQDTVRYLRDYATKVNVEYARKLGINRAAAVTCVKPAGNSSVLYDTARGINARYSPYYIRRVRLNTNSPMYKVFQKSGYPVEDISDDMAVAPFYIKSPDGALIIKDISALQQLENWKLYKVKYTHHNPSVTIEYEANEVGIIIDWLYDNQDIISGLSFLPKNDMVYKNAPYEEITKEKYEQAIKSLPTIDFSLLQTIEATDNMAYDLECAGGVCDLT